MKLGKARLLYQEGYDEGYSKAKDRITELKEKTGKLKLELEIIGALCVDYDGNRKAEDLMKLIDEIKLIAYNATDFKQMFGCKESKKMSSVISINGKDYKVQQTVADLIEAMKQENINADTRIKELEADERAAFQRMKDAEEAMERMMDEKAQLEARIKELEAGRDAYKLALEEALPECWDTLKAEEIIRDALKSH